MPIVKALIEKRNSVASTATNSVLNGTNTIASNGKRPRFKVNLASKMELDFRLAANAEWQKSCPLDGRGRKMVSNSAKSRHDSNTDGGTGIRASTQQVPAVL